MARRRKIIPEYGTVNIKGKIYYRTRVCDKFGHEIAVYGDTREEVYKKVEILQEQIDNNVILWRDSPLVKDYCEKWLVIKSAQVRYTTMVDYTSKVRRHIIPALGDMHMADVTQDDIRMALVPVSKYSKSVYKSVVILTKCIFRSAQESKVIDRDPSLFLAAEGGGVPQEERIPLTDEQVEKLLEAIKGLPPYLFVMLGLYAGLRREEILALQWDCVFLDGPAPYLTVQRAWHTENNKPVILSELKTNAARRNIPCPERLAQALREAKESSNSDFVI